MQATINYKDLATEVDILLIRINDLETEHKRLRKMMFVSAPKGVSAVDYSKTRVTSSRDPYPLDEIVKRMDEIADNLDPLYQLMEDKKATLKAIKDKVDGMEGLENKVAYMRFIEGKTLRDIAYELQYSEEWIRKVSMNLGTKWEQNS